MELGAFKVARFRACVRSFCSVSTENMLKTEKVLIILNLMAKNS